METQAQYDTHTDMTERLQAPFDESLMEMKPERGLDLPYFHWTVYQQRLDEVFGLNWTADFVKHGDGQIECEITVNKPDGTKVTRCDVGEDEEITIKATGEVRKIFGTGRAQAFKRAAVAFGVGRYVYQMKPQKKGQRNQNGRPPQQQKQAPPPAQQAPATNGKSPPPDDVEFMADGTQKAGQKLIAEINKLGPQVYGEKEWADGVSRSVAEWGSEGRRQRVSEIAQLSQQEAEKVLKGLRKRLEGAE